MTPLQKHYQAVASLGCLACKADGFGHVDPSLHHPYGRKGQNEWLVIPLCHTHHQGHFNGEHYDWKVSVHPWRRRFESRYGSADFMLAEVARLIK